MQPVDDHTLHELQIISDKRNDDCVFNYFNKTKSYGGRDFLKNMIRIPKQSLAGILSVQELIKAISQNIDSWKVDISHAYIAAAENYYGSNIAYTMSQDVFQHWFQTMIFAYRHPTEYYHVESGLTATIRVLRALNEMILQLNEHEIKDEIKDDFSFMKSFFNSFVLKPFLKTNQKSLPKRTVFYLDYYFRKQHKVEFRRILDIYYKLDAFMAIALTSREYTLSFPEFVLDKTCFDVSDIWHPLIPNAVKNSFSLHGDSGICILTGANTSGKTTFLKSAGIVISLAHLGWPVPARNLRLSFIDQLFTSIHLTDDLVLGYSHFYNEMMRIKSIAEALSRGENCFIIIDELFRGTNQEDALFCSKTVVDGFSNYKNSIFMISTHLMELLDNYLKSPLVSFHCFRTKITGSDFENTFRLEPGIAAEKVGKLIMEKVGIPELLKISKK